MLNFKYSIKSLYTKKLFFILTFLQLVCSICLLYYGFSYENYIKEKVSAITNMFRSQTVYKISFKNGQVEYLKSLELKKLKELYNYVNNSKEMYKVRYYSDGIILNKFEGYKTFEIPETQEEGTDYFIARQLSIEKNFKDNFIFNMHQGRYFTENEFSGDSDYIPAILGYDYINVYKLNSEIPVRTPYGNKKLKVVGFLQKDYTFFKLATSFSPNNLEYLNKYIIIPEIYHAPANELNEKVSLYQGIVNGVLVISDKEKESEIIKHLIEEANGVGIEIYCQSLKDSISEFSDRFKIDIYISKVLSTIILIFTLISMNVGMLNYILKNTKQFGIHIMNGATTSDIVKRIIYEYLIITLGAYIFSGYFIKVVRIGPAGVSEIKIFIEIFIILIFIVLISTIIPILKIHKLGINQFIKGEE